ncbi:DUF4164 domain-containing protein [Ehrlichia ruminantium]|nr:DUF4164 family protein [Ehrlichia ruminantium]QLK53455.1 DUF4164 family protein [Ehrlichia ruminantium]QLK54373.1 DUF4164 family protein [Ehrlichia ruminantium]QLK57125.1 DUF4164 family protein [Ehrlichia ruminantium]QLK58040.1 DUF4164 family protein [Ehrlichia ruminantium]
MCYIVIIIWFTMDQTNSFSNSEIQQSLDQAFDNLENLLKEKLSNNNHTLQNNETIALLNVEKNQLNQQLLEKINECNNWKVTCNEVINRLNTAIEGIRSILNKEQAGE